MIKKEDDLQIEFEKIEKEEIEKVCGDKGLMAIKKAYPEQAKAIEPPPSPSKGERRTRRGTEKAAPTAVAQAYEPFVMKQFNRKSYLGDAIQKALDQQMDKMVNVDKEAIYYSKEKVCKLEA